MGGEKDKGWVSKRAINRNEKVIGRESYISKQGIEKKMAFKMISLKKKLLTERYL